MAELQKRLDNAKEMKKDFMQGGGKANPFTDPMTRQSPNYNNYKRKSYVDIDAIYRDSSIVQNIVDIPAEDMVREGFEIKTDNDEIRQKLDLKLDELDWKHIFKKALIYSRKYGDGFIAIGTTENGEFELEEELSLNNVKEIDYIHAFSPKKINEIEMNEDLFSENYGYPEFYRIKIGTTDVKVHPSRLIRFHEDIEEDEIWGRSVLEPMMDIIKVFDTSLWSTGQIMFDYTFKVLKSKDVENMSKSELQQARMLMDFMFRTEALALIGEDESLEKHTTPLGGLSELYNYIWEVLAGAAQMPKNVILGQQQGTITGGQYDILNYFNRIKAKQENILRSELNKLIDIILNTDEFNMPNLDYEIDFNSLWQLDKIDEADLKLKLSQVDNNYLSWGVLSPEQVLEMRFGDLGIEGELDFNQVDSAVELEYINEIKQQRRGDQ